MLSFKLKTLQSWVQFPLEEDNLFHFYINLFQDIDLPLPLLPLILRFKILISNITIYISCQIFVYKSKLFKTIP